MLAALRALSEQKLHQIVLDRLDSHLLWCNKNWWQLTPRVWRPRAQYSLQQWILREADEGTLESEEPLRQVALDLVIGYRYDLFMRTLKPPLTAIELPVPVTAPSEPPALTLEPPPPPATSQLGQDQ